MRGSAGGDAQMSFRVLLADDDPTIRFLLDNPIRNWGYELILAENGTAALDILNDSSPPPIALLDWVMPGADGIEVCRRIKSDDARPFTYVILLTSKSEKKDVVAGLDAGADDYLTKPLNIEELRSRLAVAARMIAYDQRLNRYARELESLADERARQLVHADRLATLGTLSASIIHEINNPVAFISTNMQLFERYWKILEPIVAAEEDRGGENTETLRTVLGDMPRLVRGAREGIARIGVLLERLKNFSRRDTARPLARCAVNDAVTSALAMCHNRIKYDVKIERHLAAPSPTAPIRDLRLEQILINLFLNSADAMAGRPDQRLTVETATSPGGGACLRVRNNGPTIPPGELPKIWEPFYTTKEEQGGTGLGLFICRQIAEEVGGRIDAENLGGGVCFTVTFPAAPEETS